MKKRKKKQRLNIKNRITNKCVCLCVFVCSYQKLKPICSKLHTTMGESFITIICLFFVFFLLVITLLTWVSLVVFVVVAVVVVVMCEFVHESNYWADHLPIWDLCCDLFHTRGSKHDTAFVCIWFVHCARWVCVSVSKDCQNFIVNMICAWLWLHLYVFIHVQKSSTNSDQMLS